MLHLIALLVGCGNQVTTETVRAERPPAHAFSAVADAPTARMKLDSSCFGAVVEEELSAPHGVPKRGPASGAASGHSSIAPASPPPRTSMAPSATASSKLATAAEAPAADEARDERRAIFVGDATTEAAGSRLDWGGTTWLSNDDSMSLASAQRVIWALQHGAAVDPAQVRPHEVLNYFSFDTAPVADGALFSVKSSAAKIDEDSMSLAFAVHGVTPTRKPLDLTLVVDRSGSMSAEGRMDYVRKGLMILTEQLRAGDRVDLVLFDDSVCTPVQDYVVGRDDPSSLTQAIAAMQPRNGTDIGIGLQEGYRIATGEGRDVGVSRTRRMILLTDALVNQGFVDPDTLSQIGTQLEAHDIHLSGVGVGADFNDKVLDKLTEKGKGAYVYVGSEAVVKRVFGAGFESLVQTVASDVRFQLDLPPSLAMERFYGEEASTHVEDVQSISYYAGTTQLFLQDLTVDPTKLNPSDPVTLTIEYRDAATGEPATQVHRTTVGAMIADDRHNVDKARALMAWTDMVATQSLGGSPCGDGFATWAERSAKVEGDAELAFVGGLAQAMCPGVTPPAPPVKAPSVAYKVRVDSDVPIAEVVLWCAGAESREALAGADTIARFERAAPGACTLTLEGATPMIAEVTVPAVGGDVRCMVRGGRISCS